MPIQILKDGDRITAEAWSDVIAGDSTLHEQGMTVCVNPRTGEKMCAGTMSGDAFWKPDGEAICGTFSYFKRRGIITVESGDNRAEEKARQIAEMLSAEVLVIEE